MNMIPSFSRFALACAVLGAIFASTEEKSAPQVHGIAVANMDRSVKPGDDFFQYANGNWMKRTEIPPDRGAVDVWTKLSDLTDERTADLVAEIAKSNPPAGSKERKVADLYNSYMDEAGIESTGLAPLRPHLDAIAAIHDKRELARALGETLRADVDALNNTNYHTPNLFGLWVAPGFDDPDRYIPYLLQGGLDMPDREYYLSDSEQMRKTREQYKAHVANMLKLAGFSEPEARAGRIVELEHAIAEVHRSLADSQDIHKANNKWTQADFRAKAPGLDWSEYFQGAGLSKVESFIVWQPEAFTGESTVVRSTPIETWKDWMAFHLIETYGDVLPKALADEEFTFFGKELSGCRSSCRDGSALCSW
jgi:putative endopeptidase